MPKSDITWAVQDLKKKAPNYALFDDYYNGAHRLTFATEKFLNAFGTLFTKLADNLCPAVVDGLCDRLVIDGWSGRNSTQAEKAWEDNNLTRVADRVHLSTGKLGDGFVLVWTNDEGDVRVYPQKARLVCVRYDEDDLGVIEVAGKVWKDCKINKYRCTLYYPDGIERYVTSAETKSSEYAPEDLNAWTAYNGDSAGPNVTNDFGIVPMFHLANNADIGEYGKSELADVVPVQDALNKTLCDMLVAMEFQAFPQRWATGLQIKIDEDTGKPIDTPFVPGADRMWTGGEGVAFGQFANADVRPYVEVQDSMRLEIARITGTPLHYMMLNTGYPSGEALRIAEGRAVKKAQDRQASYGAVWEEVMSLYLRMAGVTTNPTVEIVWRSPAPHNPLLDAETELVKQQVGVSQEQSLKELGYTDELIAEMLAANEAAAPPPMEPAPTAFTRNGSPGQTSQAAPQQQAQPNRGPVTGLKAGTMPAPIGPNKPRPQRGDYATQ